MLVLVFVVERVLERARVLEVELEVEIEVEPVLLVDMALTERDFVVPCRVVVIMASSRVVHQHRGSTPHLHRHLLIHGQPS